MIPSRAYGLRFLSGPSTHAQTIRVASKPLLQALSGRQNRNLALLEELSHAKLSRDTNRLAVTISGSGPCVAKAVALLTARMNRLSATALTVPLSEPMRRGLWGLKVVHSLELETDTCITAVREGVLIVGEQAQKAQKLLLERVPPHVALPCAHPAVVFRAFGAEIAALKATHRVVITSERQELLILGKEAGAAAIAVAQLLNRAQTRTESMPMSTETVSAMHRLGMLALFERAGVTVTLNDGLLAWYSPEGVTVPVRALVERFIHNQQTVPLPLRASRFVLRPQLAATEAQHQCVIKMDDQLVVYALEQGSAIDAAEALRGILKALCLKALRVRFPFGETMKHSFAVLERKHHTTIELEESLVMVYGAKEAVLLTIASLQRHLKALEACSQTVFIAESFFNLDHRLEHQHKVRLHWHKSEVHVIGDNSARVQAAVEAVRRQGAVAAANLPGTVVHTLPTTLPLESLYPKAQFRNLLCVVERDTGCFVTPGEGAMIVRGASDKAVAGGVEALDSLLRGLEANRVTVSLGPAVNYERAVAALERSTHAMVVILLQGQEEAQGEVYHEDGLEALVVAAKLKARALQPSSTVTRRYFLPHRLLPLLTHNEDAELRRLERSVGFEAGHGCRFKVYRRLGQPQGESTARKARLTVEISAPTAGLAARAVEVLRAWLAAAPVLNTAYVPRAVMERLTGKDPLGPYELRCMEEQTGCQVYWDGYGDECAVGVVGRDCESMHQLLKRYTT